MATPMELLHGPAPWTGRRHRHVSRVGVLAHVEVKGLGVEAAVADAVERAVTAGLAATAGIVRAEINRPLGRVVVELADGDDLGAVVAATVDVIVDVERRLGLSGTRFPVDRPEHPADPTPILREAVAVAAGAVATGVAVAGRLARVVAVPAEVSGAIAVAQTYPQIRNTVAMVTGPAVADVGLTVAGAGVQALAQGSVGLLADLGHRASLLAEARARRAAWTRAQDDLCAPGRIASHAGVMPSARDVPLHRGPVEAYTSRAAMASAAAAAGTFAATVDPRRAVAAALATTPKAARVGRDVFAAHLGRILADRDIICLDNGALRRLDRIDTVVIDEHAVVTGATSVTRVDVVGDVHPGEARHRVRDLFDAQRPTRRVRRHGWSLRPLTRPEHRQLAHEAAPALHLLALRSGEDVVAVVSVDRAVDPLARAVADATKRAGLMLVVAGSRVLADRLRADLYLPPDDEGDDEGEGEGGGGLACSIRTLQEDGCGVALVAADTDAFALADLGIGLVTTTVPWAADLLVPDLAGAALVIDAVTIAHDVSRQGTALALGGSAVGGVLALTAVPGRAAARATAAVNGAAIAALANGARAALALGTHPTPSADDHPPWHELDVDEVLAHLDTPPDGLSDEEAAVRLRRGAAVDDAPVSFPAAVLEELANPFTPVLAGAAALSSAVGSMTDAAMVAGVIGVNAFIGGAQRYQVERAVRLLETRSSQRVRVRRDTVTHTVGARELVPGDIVELTAGDSVPADCRILEATGLEVDESSLTGESVPVSKSADPALSPVVAEHTSMVYDGTLIAAGTVTAVVVATGADTEARREIEGTAPPTGGVETRLRELSRVTVPLAGLAGVGIVGAGLLRGRPIPQSLHTGVSLAVAAVPEGLPILATMAQLSAARRLSVHGALVRNPRAIEALGRVDLLCCDKTGTLTEGRIELHSISDGRTVLDLDDPSGAGAAVLAAAVRASPLPNSDDDPLPHLTDRAVVDGASRLGVDPRLGVQGWRRRDELPFEPARGYHAVLGRNGRSFVLNVKGAPEVILPRCDRWRRGTTVTDLDDAVRAELEATVEGLARRGYRILAVAERDASSRADLDDERIERLHLLGFVALSDPVRPAAAASVASLGDAGVRTVMITGDHPSTAEGIAAELGLLNGHRVLTGPELDDLDDDALDAVLDDTGVFARVTPTHKVRLVAAFQRRGRTVAMTGDGSNDAPAIRLADVGVALGEHSTSAARAVADVVVADGRIETLIDAIVEGRAMWASVREAIAVLVGGNLGEILFTVAASVVTDQALAPRQLLLVNLLTDGAPALAIAVRSPRGKRPEDLLSEGPDASLGTSLERQIVSRAIATATGAGVAWTSARLTGRATRASTVALAGLVGTQLGQTLVVGGRDPVVLAASLSSAAALVVIIQTPGLSQFFGCTPLGPVGWAQALGGSATGMGLAQVLPPLIGRIPRFADAHRPPPSDLRP